MWEQINEALRRSLRKKSGRNAEPSASVIDSQSIKTTERGGVHGYDGGKKISGRKRHLLVDTVGLLLKAKVHAADILDNRGGKLLLENLSQEFPGIRHCWADMGYRGDFPAWCKENLGWTIEVVKRPSKWGTLSTGCRAAGNAAFYGSQASLGGRANDFLDWTQSKNEQRLRVSVGSK